jgi:hypothetical protein
MPLRNQRKSLLLRSAFGGEADCVDTKHLSRQLRQPRRKPKKNKV